MKKFFVILAALVAFGISANAQRSNTVYASAGVINRFGDAGLNPGAILAVGFRNYNPDSFVSFSYGAEAMGLWLPDGGANSFGFYGVPEIGVTIGSKNFKVFPHTGFMMGYGTDRPGAFGRGIKSGLGFDIGRHITLDFSSYYTFNTKWTSAVNFVYRF